MKNTTYLTNLKSLRLLSDWEKYLEAGAAESSDDDSERLLGTIFGAYRQELRYRLGLAEPFLDNMHRWSIAKDATRTIDQLFDLMTAQVGNEPLPSAAKAFVQYCFGIALDLTSVIHFVETERPELAEYFADERKSYAETREAEAV